MMYSKDYLDTLTTQSTSCDYWRSLSGYFSNGTCEKLEIIKLAIELDKLEQMRKLNQNLEKIADRIGR